MPENIHIRYLKGPLGQGLYNGKNYLVMRSKNNFSRLARTSLKSVEVPPPNAGFFGGGSWFLLYFHFFLTKSFRRKYRILQILWRMSEKSMEVISSIRELKFCFFWKKWSVFSRFFTFLNFKNKILKKQRNFTYVSIMISAGFQKIMYWIKSREYF